MMVLSLCRALCSKKIPTNVGTRLGDGADGEVFAFSDDPNKVIKLCVLYDRFDKPIEKLYTNSIATTLDYLIDNPIDVFARVYEHKYLGQYSRDWTFSNNEMKLHSDTKGKQQFILYYYTMEKLEKISEDEGKVFHSILSHEDRGIRKNYSMDEVRKMLHGLHRGLDFDEKRVMFFVERLKKAPIYHTDIHARNIMKDSAGNFKLIDFDRTSINGE